MKKLILIGMVILSSIGYSQEFKILTIPHQGMEFSRADVVKITQQGRTYDHYVGDLFSESGLYQETTPLPVGNTYQMNQLKQFKVISLDDVFELFAKQGWNLVSATITDSKCVAVIRKN